MRGGCDLWGFGHGKSTQRPFLTHEKLKNEFLCMEMDCVRVKGKTKPVRIYPHVGRKAASASHAETIGYFRQGLQACKEQKWDKALEAFKTVSAMDRGVYDALRRCSGP